MALLKHCEKFSPPQEINTKMDEEAWYGEILYEIVDSYDGIVEASIKELISEPVRLEHVSPLRDSEWFSCYYLVIGETFHFLPDHDERLILNFRLSPDWDDQLKEVCTKYGIKARKPQFHFCIDYSTEYWVEGHVNGAFFYGIEFATYDDDPRALLQKIIEFDSEIFLLKDERGFYKYNPFNWPPDPERDDQFRLEYLISDLDAVWKNRGDAVCISTMDNREHWSIYLAIRSTHHTVNDHHDDSFDLPEIDREEWDRLLHDKCDKYGFSFKSPSFHLLVDDS